jgi:hypothetical protein
MKNSLEALLETDHESLAQLLASLDAELAKPNATVGFELLDLFWARLAVHIRAENLHLFPALINTPALRFTGKGGLPVFVEVQDLLLRLRSDHDFFMKELAQLVNVMREVVDYPHARSEQVEEVRQRLIVIKQRLEVHNRLEEEQAYTWPALLFDQGTAARVFDGLQHELENLPPRFA